MNQEQYINSTRKLLKRIHPVSWRILLAISESDYRGRTLPGVDTEPYIAGERMREAIRSAKLDEAPTKPLISGSDLIPLGVEPGAKMGEIIKQVEAARDAGEISSRKDALEFIKKLVG
jgi:hypothetical protein